MRPVAPCCISPCLPTYAESLAATNCALRAVDRVDAGPIPFAEYLRATNAADRLAMEQARAGALIPTLARAARPESTASVATPAGAGLPRLGDVSPVTADASVRRVEETYQVRNLLSRGALIDLCG